MTKRFHYGKYKTNEDGFGVNGKDSLKLWINERMDNFGKSDKHPDQSRPALLCCMMPVLNSPNSMAPIDPGVQKLLSSLREIRTRTCASESDLSFLTTLLQNDSFQSVLRVHGVMSQLLNKELSPNRDHATEIAEEVLDDLRCHPFSSEALELTKILCKPHVKGLLTAHDVTARKEYSPHLPDIPHEVDEDADQATIKIVRLVKNNEPLGATIKILEETKQIIVARVMHGGAADRSGLIQVGDEVQEVNGVSVNGRNPAEIVDILSSVAGPITLKLIPCALDGKCHTESKLRVRALFNYDPGDDKYTPCREAGLPFRQGDILQIVDQDDQLWWQARKEGDPRVAGLIPSRQLQERITANRCNIDHQCDLNNTLTSSTTSATTFTTNSLNRARNRLMEKFSPKIASRQRKTRKVIYDALHNGDEWDSEEIVTYEEVETYIPPTGLFRPIILIGPSGVGKRELKSRLERSDRTFYQCCIPHTSRPAKAWEIDGVDYHFISREEIERGITDRRYAEHCEHNGYLYATEHDDIHTIISRGKVPLLSTPPQSIKQLRTCDIRPYVVFIKPPSYERLKSTRTSPAASPDEEQTQLFTNEEFKEIVLNAGKLSVRYGHLIDYTLVNDDLESTLEELRKVIHKAQNDPQWVPVKWLR